MFRRPWWNPQPTPPPEPEPTPEPDEGSAWVLGLRDVDWARGTVRTSHGVEIPLVAKGWNPHVICTLLTQIEVWPEVQG